VSTIRPERHFTLEIADPVVLAAAKAMGIRPGYGFLPKLSSDSSTAVSTLSHPPVEAQGIALDDFGKCSKAFSSKAVEMRFVSSLPG